MKAAIIVAGGMGTRMNSSIPKQFLLIDRKPVVMHPMQAFYRFDPAIRLLLVLPGDLFEQWNDLQRLHDWHVPHEVIPGGTTRFHSVKNGLDRLSDKGLVAIHDGARPLLSVFLIERLFDIAANEGSAVPVVPVNESVRITEGTFSRPSDRSSMRIVQTPQVFHLSRIKQAYDQPYHEVFTDDATVYESAGNRVFLMEGDPVNIKVTYPADLVIAEALVKSFV